MNFSCNVIVVVGVIYIRFINIKAKLHYTSLFGASSELAELASVIEFGFYQPAIPAAAWEMCTSESVAGT